MRLTRRSIDISTTHRNLNTIRTIALFIKYSRQSAHHPQHHVGQRSLQLITFITQMSECVRAQIFCASIQPETIIHKTVCLSIVLFRVQNKNQTHRAASLREEWLWLSLIVGYGSFSPNRISSNELSLKAKKGQSRFSDFERLLSPPQLLQHSKPDCQYFLTMYRTFFMRFSHPYLDVRISFAISCAQNWDNRNQPKNSINIHTHFSWSGASTNSLAESEQRRQRKQRMKREFEWVWLHYCRCFFWLS